MDENIYIADFARRLNALRQAKDVAAHDMSLSIGLSHNFIHNIEMGKNFPTMLNFFYICEYLGISAQDFFDYQNQSSVEDNEILAEIKQLDTKSKEYIRGLIKDINSRPK